MVLALIVVLRCHSCTEELNNLGEEFWNDLYAKEISIREIIHQPYGFPILHVQEVIRPHVLLP